MTSHQPHIYLTSRELTDKEIAAGAHRELVGGSWDEIGALQFYFLRSEGLRPEHTLVDVGCGALRGGVHFVAYLDEGNYCGIDRNRSLVIAGRRELEASGTRRSARLLVNDGFEVALFGAAFDYALAISLFTHLPSDEIARCLRAVGEVLEPHGRFYASFFQSPRSTHVEPIRHEPGGVTTYVGAEHFHYSWEKMQTLGAEAGLAARLIGDWRHPERQQMVCFTRPPPA
jgi:cyclopropane fatty-acyl-phospholipid synthase-like methyltransferase